MSVHSTHCCIHHGCKYADEDCPVVLGLEDAEYPCEDCDQDGSHVIFGEWAKDKSEADIQVVKQYLRFNRQFKFE